MEFRPQFFEYVISHYRCHIWIIEYIIIYMNIYIYDITWLYRMILQIYFIWFYMIYIIVLLYCLHIFDIISYGSTMYPFWEMGLIGGQKMAEIPRNLIIYNPIIPRRNLVLLSIQGWPSDFIPLHCEMIDVDELRSSRSGQTSPFLPLQIHHVLPEAAGGGLTGEISMRPRLGAGVGVAAWNGGASALHAGGAVRFT